MAIMNCLDGVSQKQSQHHAEYTATLICIIKIHIHIILFKLDHFHPLTSHQESLANSISASSETISQKTNFFPTFLIFLLMTLIDLPTKNNVFTAKPNLLTIFRSPQIVAKSLTLTIRKIPFLFMSHMLLELSRKRDRQLWTNIDILVAFLDRYSLSKTASRLVQRYFIHVMRTLGYQHHVEIRIVEFRAILYRSQHRIGVLFQQKSTVQTIDFLLVSKSNSIL